MRKIKFRAMMIGKKWVYGDYTVVNMGLDMYECIVEREKESATPIVLYTLGQYTGITDMNGTEIYEGDIVVADSEYGDKITDIVCWSYGSFYVANHTFKQINNVEVIGNIYEHKHLLEENENENK